MKIRSYTSIWKVDRFAHGIGDVPLPRPIAYTQIAWGLGVLLITFAFARVPPLSLLPNAFYRHVVVPIAVSWLMSQKTFDGKRPFSFLRSITLYILRPKRTYMGKAIRLRKIRACGCVTVARGM